MVSLDVMRYETPGGVVVERSTNRPLFDNPIDQLIDALDESRGVLLASNYEYPGRYTRWDIGFVDPPVQITAYGRVMQIEACNDRGVVLLGPIAQAIGKLGPSIVKHLEIAQRRIDLTVAMPTTLFTEEQRSRQPSVFSVVRAIIACFSSEDDHHLGLYGAFGYDLAFQFDSVELHHERNPEQRDLVLYLPDEITVVDRQHDTAFHHRYEFTVGDMSTHDLPRTGHKTPYLGHTEVSRQSDHKPGEYAAIVEKAREYFRRGDLFEVVPGKVFFEPCPAPPSQLFRQLKERNPAPYGALINLGESEYLVAASPEMYVRIEGRRVETCPISGTVARGNDVLADADQIRRLLNSSKDESELTMCTDVDRNDKSRVCEPGSIRVIGRRLIEMYSRVIHTVDHVEGRLQPGFDALDAFLTHTWAVTVTGAPKLWAMRFIEQNERSARAWYGGALGFLGFDGNANTGLTLRTVWVKNGVAQVRAGATLLIDSDPIAEEEEVATKASALLDVIRHPTAVMMAAETSVEPVGDGVSVVLVDHEDSFVHTLAGYLRRTGAAVTTVRVASGSRLDAEQLRALAPDLMVISPGPGRPEDFALSHTIASALEQRLPIFGVCLGLQGIVEYFGGKLDVLAYPAHGRASEITVTGGSLFKGLPGRFEAGRYHSLFAQRSTLPAELLATAETDDGVIMAIEHRSLPIAAVQFHPESLLTMKGDLGLRLIENVLRQLVQQKTG